ncbi:MAG: 16S rRNA (uracil(1498)-N(3))-methyltransferase [Parvibaculales bacterium]
MPDSCTVPQGDIPSPCQVVKVLLEDIMQTSNPDAPDHCGTGKIRIYLDPVKVPDLAQGLRVTLDGDQHHYLRNVMRCRVDTRLLVFNGRHGEWQAAIREMTKKLTVLELEASTRPHADLPDIWLVFAPLKRARMDYLAQKATEMGAGVLLPMRTRFTQGGQFKLERLAANAVEAAEQCGLVQVPEVRDLVSLDTLMQDWENYAPGRRIIFCDEKAPVGDALSALKGLRGQPVAVFIGPEGGFSDAERDQLAAHPLAQPISLGPRILRADTAGVAALALCQSCLGDW